MNQSDRDTLIAFFLISEVTNVHMTAHGFWGEITSLIIIGEFPEGAFK